MSEPRSVLIAGVGVGLGTSMARRFAAAGHPVALLARKAEVITPLADEIKGSGGKVKAFILDAANSKAVAQAFSETESELAPLGLAICNATHRLQKPFLDLTADEFERSVRINTLSAFNIASQAAHRMVPRGSGSIFFTGARSATRGIPKLTIYALTKGGMRNMAQSLARELGPQGIHIAHFNLDGGLDNPHTRERDPHLVEKDGLIDTDAIAELYFQTHLQPRSAWSLDVECRPWIEPF